MPMRSFWYIAVLVLSLPGIAAAATGSQQLIDASGVKYFIDTNITFSTSSSASGAMSEASYTHAVAATTMNGGTVMSTLNDAYDGYNAMCISHNNTVATCETGNANFTIYNKNGVATTECPGPISGVHRQVVLNPQTIGPIQVHRKVFVPDNDAFARWLNYFTNTDTSPHTVTMVTSNNLGSDSNTRIVSSSNGNATAELTDTWVTTFQNYSGTTSSDPRLGHVLQGPGAPVGLAGINFANGDDNPFWGYTFTLAPGQTAIIMNFAVVQPSKAAAAAQSAALVALPAHALQCMSAAERTQVVNFVVPPPIIAFATFTAQQLNITLRPFIGSAFALQSHITLGAGSDGFAPWTDKVELTLTGGAGAFTTTIPAGAFHRNSLGQFTFTGTINGVQLNAAFTPLGCNLYAPLGCPDYKFEITGNNADLNRIVNPVTVKLTIGNDGGSTIVTATFVR